MQGKYRCFERKCKELEKMKKEFDEYLINVRKTYVKNMVKYESVSDISSAVFSFDNEKWNQILGEKKVDFL